MNQITISVKGKEGCGKTVIATLLTDYLRKFGYVVNNEISCFGNNMNADANNMQSRVINEYSNIINNGDFVFNRKDRVVTISEEWVDDE